MSGETTVVVVGCGAAKASAAAPASELYIGSLFRAARAWAVANGDRWAILSAKHGLLLPDQVIEPYDVRLPRSGDELRAWIVRANEAIWSTFFRGSPPRLVVLAGSDYAEAIDGPKHRALFGAQLREIVAEYPLDGLGLGKRLAWLRARPLPRAGTAVDLDDLDEAARAADTECPSFWDELTGDIDAGIGVSVDAPSNSALARYLAICRPAVLRELLRRARCASTGQIELPLLPPARAIVAAKMGNEEARCAG